MPLTIDELFPPSPREFYEKAPLVQVICQLRFPKLLTIEAQPPAQFQERIRGAFPLYEQGASSLVQMPDLPPQVLQALGAQFGEVNHQFYSEDKQSVVTLGPQTLSLATKSYTQWEDFRARLAGPLNAFVETYAPPFFSRVGLRYIDEIRRAPLGLQDEPWSRLINLGQFSFPAIEPNVELAAHQIIASLPGERGYFALRHGFMQSMTFAIMPAGFPQLPDPPNIPYGIDFDFFQPQKTEIADAIPTLNDFHELAGRAFRRCITQQLRDALRPTLLDQRGAREPPRAADAAH